MDRETLTDKQIEQHRREAEYEKGNSHRAKVIVKLCDHIADLRARLKSQDVMLSLIASIVGDDHADAALHARVEFALTERNEHLERCLHTNTRLAQELADLRARLDASEQQAAKELHHRQLLERSDSRCPLCPWRPEK